MPTDLREYYRVLELSPGASLDEIKRAYRQLLQRWHPDRYKPGSLMQTTAEDVTKELNEAYHQLCRKKRYLEFRPKARPASTRVRTGATRDPWARAARHGWKVYEDAAEPARPVSPPTPTEPPPAPPPRAAPVRRRRPWPWRGIGGGAVLAGGIWLGVYLIAHWPESDAPVAPLAKTARAESPPVVVTRPAATLAVAARTVVFAPQTETRFAEIVPMKLAMAPAPWPEKLETVAPKSFSAPTWTPPLRTFASAPVEEDAWSLLDTFAPGDTRARVLAVQGVPDEVGENLFRYGSSVVYFEEGRVAHWSEGRPRLRVLVLPRFEFKGLARFGVGSTRAEVMRAQGEPTQTTNDAFYYGASAVYFDREWVTGWHEVDQPLRARPAPLSLAESSVRSK